MKTKIGPLLERIEKAREVMGTKPLQKLDKILLQAEKLLITAAKATGIRVDDIEGFPDEEDTETPEEEDTDESEEIDEESDDTEPAPVSEELPAEPVD
jgi:ribosomal protein L12E/L44/L45/RPP1/RPP2